MQWLELRKIVGIVHTSHLSMLIPQASEIALCQAMWTKSNFSRICETVTVMHFDCYPLHILGRWLLSVLLLSSASGMGWHRSCFPLFQLLYFVYFFLLAKISFLSVTRSLTRPPFSSKSAAWKWWLLSGFDQQPQNPSTANLILHLYAEALSTSTISPPLRWSHCVDYFCNYELLIF